MSVLSQILGSSFGRSPAMFGGGGVHMPQLPQVQMARAPTRAEMNGAAPPPNAGGDLTSAIVNKVLPPQAPPVPGASGPPAPTTAGDVPGGVMNSIMGAFNGGAGGGMDIAKLLAMIGAA